MKTTAAWVLYPLMILTCGLLRAEEAPTTRAIDGLQWVDLLQRRKAPAEGEFLQHWRRVNCAAGTFGFMVDPEDPDSEILRCTGIPTGILRSAEVYENFMCEFQWRHMTRDGMKANAGFFIWSDALPERGIPFSRSVEVQVANFDRNTDWFTRHGDIFPIHGAQMTPDPRFGVWEQGQRSLPLEFRAKDTGEWNHYRITAIDGVVQLEVNGSLVSGGFHCLPRVGHLMIESEGGEVHFRQMRVLRLPESPRPLIEGSLAKVMDQDRLITALYDGIELAGAGYVNEALFQSQDYRLQIGAGEGSATVPFGTRDGEWSLLADLFSEQGLAELPVQLVGLDLPALKLEKGVHRVRFDVAEGVCQVSIDGEAVGKGKVSSQALVIKAQSAPLTLTNLLLID